MDSGDTDVLLNTNATPNCTPPPANKLSVHICAVRQIYTLGEKHKDLDALKKCDVALGLDPHSFAARLAKANVVAEIGAELKAVSRRRSAFLGHLLASTVEQTPS